VHFQAGADATPPAIDIPADMTVDATGPSGAVVTYSVSGHDDVDGAVPVACSPASGALFPIGTTTVVCTATDAAGNSSAASFKVTVAHQFLSATRVSLPTNDLVFDPLSQKIYASVPGRAGALGNRVVVIDPATGAIGASVFVGSEPGKLALSADGQFLYVALNGAAAVRRVELPSLTPGLQFSLGSDPFFGPYLADDLEVLPEDSGAVAVARMNSGISPRHAGVAIYDEGVKRPDETPRHTGSNVIEFGSAASRLYGYNNETTEFGFRRMTVSASGVSTLDVTSNLISNFGVDIEFDSGKVYATTGKVVDPEARSLLGTFPLSSAGLVESHSIRGKVYFLSSGTLSEFDQATFTLLRSFAVSGISGTPSSLVNIGNSDLAFRTSADQVFLAHFQDAPPPPPSVCSRQGDVLTINVPSGAAVAIGRSGANFNVTGAGNPDPGCGGATVNNVNTVNVNGAGGNETVTYATTGGNFEPGATAEGAGISEIELYVSLGGGTDSLIAQLGALNDRFTIGTAGINPNNDADVDLSLAGVENLTVKGGAGPDVISAGGANGTGSAYATRVILQGEGGSDTLSGGLGNDSIDGGIGGDTFKALNVRDGADDFVGGAGEDTANYSALPASAGGVIVDPDNNPDDGANDGDNIHSDVEKVTGSSGADVIDDGGQVVRNVFKGGGGNDSINTVDGVGNDKIDGGGGTGDSCTGDAGDTIVNCP
jgi:hypothetical protein